MAKSTKPQITAKNVLSVPSGEYPCGNNLYLVVADSGGRRWTFRYQRNGIVKKMGFGSANIVKFSDAKTLALNALRDLAHNIDPKDQRDKKRRAEGSRLFGAFADEWRETFEVGLKHPAARRKLKRIVEVICKPLRQLRLDEVETQHIVTALKPVWHLRETSRDARLRIKKILDAAIAHNLRAKDNPADWNSRLAPIMPKQPRRGTARGSHKALDHRELPKFMRTLAEVPSQSARALEVTILTLARTIEVQRMRWPQLGLADGLWDQTPQHGTKNERPKRTPLPQQALAYLREAEKFRVSEFVFPGRSLRQPISNMTMLKLLKEISGDPKLTVHGFRSTFRTWAQEETDFEEEIIEHCLHHITGDEAEKAYKRGEALRKRRVIMQAFADYAMGQAKEGAA